MSISDPHLLRPRYRADIDGLRAFAVLSVVAFHAFPGQVGGGFTGVDVFFVISGYLISTIIFQNLERGTFSLGEFYARRVRRIFPALLLVLVCSYLFGWFVLLADEYKQLGKHVAAGAGFLSNLALWSESGYFDTAAESKPLLHLWSLGIEEQFYIVWPLLLWLAWRLKVGLLAVTACLALLSFSLNIGGVDHDAVATFYSPQTRIWELLGGSLLGWLMLRPQAASRSVGSDGADSRLASPASPVPVVGKAFANALSFVGSLLLLYGLWQFDKEMSFPGTWALVPVLGAVLVIVAGPDAWINRTLLSNKVIVWFGLISFPLYLWHWPLLSFARIVAIEEPTSLLRWMLICVSVAAAWLTYRVVETPIRSGGLGKRAPALMVGLMCGVGVLGLVAFAQDGIRSRAIVVRVDSLFSKSAMQREADLLAQYRDYVGRRGDPGRPVVLILGDSYATQWTPALLSHIDSERFDIATIKYLGCKVRIDAARVEVEATKDEFRRNCDAFASLVNDDAVNTRIRAVMLVSHRPFEYKDNGFRFELVRWLKKRNAALDFYVFGNYFQLDRAKRPTCEKLMVRARRDARVCIAYADYPPADLKPEELPLYPEGLDLRYVDILKLHCGDNAGDCATEARGVPFMSDWNHLNSSFVDWLLLDLRSRRTKELAAIGLLPYFRSDQP